MMEPEPYELPDGIVLTTLGEARRCGWEFTWRPAGEWWDGSNPVAGSALSDDSPVLARNPNPPKPLEAGQVREQHGNRFVIVGPSVLVPDHWVCEFERRPTGNREVVTLASPHLASLPVVEQEPREQKPRRMKANPRCGDGHDVEHDERADGMCDSYPPCTPVEQEGEG